VDQSRARRTEFGLIQGAEILKRYVWGITALALAVAALATSAPTAGLELMVQKNHFYVSKRF
jgi:hypothetical protein